MGERAGGGCATITHTLCVRACVRARTRGGGISSRAGAGVVQLEGLPFEFRWGTQASRQHAHPPLTRHVHAHVHTRRSISATHARTRRSAPGAHAHTRQATRRALCTAGRPLAGPYAFASSRQLLRLPFAVAPARANTPPVSLNTHRPLFSTRAARISLRNAPLSLPRLISQTCAAVVPQHAQATSDKWGSVPPETDMLQVRRTPQQPSSARESTSSCL